MLAESICLPLSSTSAIQLNSETRLSSMWDRWLHITQVSIFLVFIQFKAGPKKRGFGHSSSTLPRNDSHCLGESHVSFWSQSLTQERRGMLWLAGTRSWSAGEYSGGVVSPTLPPLQQERADKDYPGCPVARLCAPSAGTQSSIPNRELGPTCLPPKDSACHKGRPGAVRVNRYF